MHFHDVDDGGSYESANTTPHIIHNGKAGVKELWGLEDSDIVLIASECFDDVSLLGAERVWESVLAACADSWMRQCGTASSERRKWLSRNLRNLQDAVVAAEKGVKLDWLSRCEEWKWDWCGDD